MCGWLFLSTTENGNTWSPCKRTDDIIGYVLSLLRISPFCGTNVLRLWDTFAQICLGVLAIRIFIELIGRESSTSTGALQWKKCGRCLWPDFCNLIKDMWLLTFVVLNEPRKFQSIPGSRRSKLQRNLIADVNSFFFPFNITVRFAYIHQNLIKSFNMSIILYFKYWPVN